MYLEQETWKSTSREIPACHIERETLFNQVQANTRQKMFVYLPSYPYPSLESRVNSILQYANKDIAK